MAHIRKFRAPPKNGVIYIHCQNPKCGKLVEVNSFHKQFCCKKCEQEAQKAGLVVVR